MIDYFALALTHALIFVVLLRIVTRPDLDGEDPSALQEAGAKEEKVKTKRREERAARRQKARARDA